MTAPPINLEKPDYASTRFTFQTQLSNVAIQEESFVITFCGPTLKGHEIIDEQVKQMAVQNAKSLSPGFAQKIRELSELRQGWDGESAEPIKPRILADAVGVVNRLSTVPDFTEPFIVPTFGGFVQIEWYSDKRLLEIEAVENGWSVTGTLIGIRGNRDYFSGDFSRNDFDGLRRVYNWFAQVELLWPF